MEAGDWVALGIGIASVIAGAALSGLSLWHAYRTTSWTLHHTLYQQKLVQRHGERLSQRRQVQDALDSVRLLAAHSGTSVDDEYMSRLSPEGLEERRELTNEAIRLLIIAEHHASSDVRTLLSKLRPAVRDTERAWLAVQPDINKIEPATELWQEFHHRLDALDNMEPDKALAQLAVLKAEMLTLAGEIRGPLDRAIVLTRAGREVNLLCLQVEARLNTWDAEQELVDTAEEPAAPRWWPV